MIDPEQNLKAACGATSKTVTIGIWSSHMGAAL